MSVKTTLNEAARIFKCHPRTILRHLTGESNPYWAEGFDCPVDTTDLSRVLKVKPLLMDAVFIEKNELLKPDEASSLLKLTPRTFRNHKYPPIVRKGHLVRWSADHLKYAFRERIELKKIL